MGQLLFLGTGPANGTKHGQKGKSKRMESSALLTFGTKHLLIDVTQFFAKQSKNIRQIDAIFITHAHGDACWGIPDLEQWIAAHDKKPIPLFSHATTIAKIKKRFPHTKYLDFIPLTPHKKIHLFGQEVTPFLVKHSIQQGFPTLGFLFNKDLAYASDVAGWSKKAARCMQKAKTLIIDGAMWQTKMPAHLTLPDAVNELCTWPNKHLIFTQIGNTAPDYEVVKEELTSRCSKAIPAYDGMKITC